MNQNITIPFIEGDGIGPEIWAVTKQIIDKAVAVSYEGKNKIEWVEILAGMNAIEKTGLPLPDETIAEIKKHKIAIKGPLTTPVGEGFKSINVQLRQILDLYACVRPMGYIKGVKSELKHPEKINMTVFRENTEDLYGGIEFKMNSKEVHEILDIVKNSNSKGYVHFPDTTAIALKIVSKQASERLIRSAINYAIAHKLPSVTIVHKGNILKFTEGGFRNWGYALAKEEFPDQTYTWDTKDSVDTSNRILIQDRIADAFFQDIILNPQKHAVVASTNLNGDYISDAIAGCIGGIGISPGANINYKTGMAIFEATHGSAPDIAGKDIANPLSLIFSGVMMLHHIGWTAAANLIDAAAKQLILKGKVTGDLSITKAALSCSEFGKALIEEMTSANKINALSDLKDMAN
ncbi:NADP-dependent isocitrate dehydrogenase [Putridiphycobacter roseus]|uniref:isocitrate dehydrogenase (NADP(+)) n=1 Tax=Putridiphycobacter roseus TaxID=2219161 RepID=A0A2W1NAM8_9FLAO|nr:isocitrate/isopropylmalate family dehydrogenase [Putridiphycobacter roseus]PZE16083.1 NADP-dependent isocitrate dehydrogenase [Putridiphycobacter roseus]